MVELNYPKEIEIDYEEAKAIDEIILNVLSDQSFYLLINFQNSYGSMTMDAQRYFAKEAPSIPQVKYAVITLNNLPVRLLVKFYLRLFKPAYPIALMGDYEEAKAFLEEQIRLDTPHLSAS